MHVFKSISSPDPRRLFPSSRLRRKNLADYHKFSCNGCVPTACCRYLTAKFRGYPDDKYLLCRPYVRGKHPPIHPFFSPSPSIHPSLPSILSSILPSILSSILPPIHPPIHPSFNSSFLLSFLPSFFSFHSFHSPFFRSLLPSIHPSGLSSFRCSFPPSLVIVYLNSFLFLGWSSPSGIVFRITAVLSSFRL